jgi:tetratricopeptide (TPR) repeat protein
VLTAKAELLLDDEERASVWRRVGEAKRDMLEDREGAIEAYERALELDPGSAFTLDCLIDLYESKGDAPRLAELYHERVALAGEDDADLKYSLLVAAAECHEAQLNDPARAIDALNQALAVRPGDPQVLQVLNRLYRLEQMWPELLENLRLRCEAAEAPEARADLRREIGSIQAQKLDNYEEALEAYRQVLDETPRDSESVEAVLRVGREHEEFRSAVAEILVPVLEKTERHEVLVDVLELRFTVEATAAERSKTLSTIAEILEKRLNRVDEAQTALLRALSEVPEAEDLHQDIERLSDLSKGWGRYADSLFERAQATFDPELAKQLYTRLGRVAKDKLEDLPRAVDAYVHALEQQGDQPDLLEALDRLYERMGDLGLLSDVLERRVGIEPSETDQAELYYRLARLQIQEFGDPGRGLSSLRMALEREGTHEKATAELEALTDQRDLFEEASEILEDVYRKAGRTDKLAGLYEKRVGFAETPEERIEMRRSLSRVLEEDCKDAASAQRVLQQGLADDPADAALLDEIERLAAVTGHWEGAARALEHALDQHALEQAGNLLPDAASRLYARLAAWYRDRVEDAEAAEQALGKALEHEPANDDVLAALERLQSVPGRELDLVATLRRRAKLKLDDAEREQLYRRAKELCDAQGRADVTEAVLRELLQQDDTNLWALSELTTVREAAGDFKETFSLLVRRSELRAQGDVVRELRRRAAVIARDQLQDRAQAIELFEQIFEDVPSDAEAAGALRALYTDAERWNDLSRFLERLIDLADSPSARTPLRLELSRLNRERFEALDTAIELLRMVLEEEPGHADAVVELSELYEKTQRDQELAELLNDQIEVAKSRKDSDAELRFQVRLGEVYENRLGDRARAIDTYQHVLGRNPEHRGALEALARLYQAEKNHTKSAEVLEKLLGGASGQEAVELAAKLSDEFTTLGDSAGAARALERGLEADSTNPELRTRLRELYRSSEQWEKLAELTAKDAAFAAEPAEQVRLLREAAEIHATRRSDFAAAAELLERASQLRPDDRELLLSLCDAYSASGRGKAAAEALERVVESYGGKRSKELGEIHRRLANAYLAEGETERALGELDKAFRIEPGNVQVLKRLGEVALELGDTKRAQQMFRALLLQKLDENSPISKAEVFMHLGEVHDKLGEKSKAVQMLERAIQTDGNLEAAKKRLAELKAR